MKIKAIFIVLSILLICCKTSEKPIDISFSKSDEDVTLFYSIKTNRVWAIGLPFDLVIENPYSRILQFSGYSYVYGHGNKGGGMKLYLKKDGQLVKQSVSKLKDIDGRQTNSYLVKSKHAVDSTRIDQSTFGPYIEKIKRLKLDTLNIGTISEVKAKHKGLLEALVQDDSILIFFVSENSGSGLRRELRRVEY